MILVISALQSLLSQLTSSHSAPHTAFISSRANGNVIAASYVPSAAPFPPATLSDKDNDERTRVYAAVAGSCWEDEHGAANPVVRNNQSDSGEADVDVLKVETELGRIAMTAIGAFYLILVGSEVAPWPVMEKKLSLAREELDEPLKRIGH